MAELISSGNIWLSNPCPHSHAAVEIHAVDTDRRVVLDAQVNVFTDAETEIASLGEIAFSELVFLHFQSTLEDLLCLGTADSDVDGYFFITSDTESSYSVSGLA